MDYRLPTTVVPSRYDIRLEPDLEAATFAGQETVAITVSEPVSEILLNAAELVIQSVSVQTADGPVVEGSASLDEAAERARLASRSSSLIQSSCAAMPRLLPGVP